MTRSIYPVAIAILLVGLVQDPAHASRGRRQVSSTRAQGGPSGLGGLPGSNANQMVRIQQQRAQRGAARQRRMTPREQILAARDRQLGGAAPASVRFTSNREAAAYTRLKARTVQLRTFAFAVVAGLGGGLFGRVIEVFGGGIRTGFREFGSLAADPSFGNPLAQVLGSEHFMIGAALGAGISLIAGSVRAAQLRRKADAIERGEHDLARLD